MRYRFLLLPALGALVVPFGAPANAAPACVMLDWRNGDSCTFEAPAHEFVFGGVATHYPDGARIPWVAMQVVFRGQVIASCFDEGTSTEPAICSGRMRAFVPTATHVCQVFGTGGPKAHCADPPPLPLPAG